MRAYHHPVEGPKAFATGRCGARAVQGTRQGPQGRDAGQVSANLIPTRTLEARQMRSDIVPGGTFPDYELPDHEDVPRRLSEIQGDDPLILTLARGHYCPKEHQQHLELAANHPKLNVAYTRIATIATDEHHTVQEFRNSVGAVWPFLADPGRIVQKDEMYLAALKMLHEENAQVGQPVGAAR